MITLQEILKNAKFSSQDSVVQGNLMILLEKINKIRTKYNKSLTVSSGLRTKEDHLRIYKAKGIPEDKIPWGSQHLTGGAVDLVAKDMADFQKWIKDNVKLLEEIGLYCEDFSATPTWVHFQINAPKSGSRFFKP